MEHLFRQMGSGELNEQNSYVVCEEGQGVGCDYPDKNILYQTGGGITTISPTEQAVIQAKSKIATKRKRSRSSSHSKAKRRKRSTSGRKRKRKGGRKKKRKGGSKKKGKKRKGGRKRKYQI